MKEFNIKEENNTVTVAGVKDFNLDHIFDCGQCFRWEKNLDGSYSGTAFGKLVHMEWTDAEHEEQKAQGAGTLKIYNSDKNDFENIWRRYLDLDRDYGSIKKYLAENDSVIKDAINYGYGIRILNQEKWETLISFIISQNNNIPRIKKCINSVAETLGEKVGVYNGTEYYSLPAPEVLAKSSIDDLEPCRLGYRAKYLIETAKLVHEEGLESLETLGNDNVSAAGALEALRRYCGVGPKVANCISLFSMGKMDSFPIDVWVKKVMNKLYNIDERNLKEMASFAAEKFGPYGGIAQQYLFYYITHNKDI